MQFGERCSILFMASFGGFIDTMGNAWVIDKVLTVDTSCSRLCCISTMAWYALGYPLLRWNLILYLIPLSRVLINDIQVCRLLRRKSSSTIQNTIPVSLITTLLQTTSELVLFYLFLPGKYNSIRSHIAMTQQFTIHWHFWALYSLGGEISS